MRGAALSILITLLAPVVLRAASKRGRITRLRPTAPLINSVASFVFSRKARVEVASTTLFFCNRLITAGPNSGPSTFNSFRRATNSEALAPGVFCAFV